MYSWYLYIYFFQPSPNRISFFGYWKHSLFINSSYGECHIILLALRRYSSLHPSSKALFSSLAISDFGVDLVAQPLFAAYTLAIAWDNPGLFCIVGLPYSLFSSFLGLVSFCTISVVALDRHLALILRFRYRRIVTFKRITLILMVAWFLSAFFTVSGTYSMNLRRIASNLMLVSCLLLALFFYLKTYTNLRQHKLRMESSFGVSYYRKSTNSMFIVFCQETIKGTERASPIYTLFHR